MGNEASSAARLWDTATLMALAAALVYVAGWTYAYHYFGHFQLGLLSLEIPREYYFLYGFWVFRDAWWLALAYVALALAFPWMQASGWARAFGKPLGDALHRLSPVVVLLLVVGVHSISVITANAHYRNQAESNFPAYPQTRVWLKANPAEDSPLKPVARYLSQGCYRLLIRDGDKLLVFQPPREAPLAQLALLDVPIDAIEAMRVLPQHGRCED